jgi:RimJ/RimL family protein N-acetyltransferase
MTWLEPIALRGRHVHLVPLEIAHCEGLEQAARDGELWRLWYTSVPTPEGMAKEIERRLRLQSQGTMLPWTVVDAGTGTIAGMTTYMNVDQDNRRVEIGSTWYAKRVQRTPLNTECKLMLLRHAFETLDCVAVEFRTSSFNQQSRKAIERLGAKPDGILRNHTRHADGTLRDTCVYSILPSEWPAVRSHLAHQLDKPR